MLRERVEFPARTYIVCTPFSSATNIGLRAGATLTKQISFPAIVQKFTLTTRAKHTSPKALINCESVCSNPSRSFLRPLKSIIRFEAKDFTVIADTDD